MLRSAPVRWLAYLHPVAMVAIVGLGLWALREGLGLRRARILGQPRASDRHRRLGRSFVLLVALGFSAGLASLGLLRREPLFESVHFVFASAALLTLGATYLVGRRLERSPTPGLRAAHRLCGGLGLLFAMGAAAAGLAILP